MRRSCQKICQACGLASKSVSRLWWIAGSASWICRWIPWAIEMAVGVPVAAEGLLSVDPRVVLWASDHLRRYKFLALRPPRACVYGHYVLHTWTRNKIHYEILWCIRPSDATKSSQSLSTTGILDLCSIISFGQRSVTRSGSQGSTGLRLTIECRLSFI